MSVERSPKLIASYLAVYFFVIGITFYLTVNYWPQTNISSMKKVRIDQGTTLSNISDKLNKKGLVTNKWVFEFLTKIKGLEKIWDYIQVFINEKKKNHTFFSDRQSQLKEWMSNSIHQTVNEMINSDLSKNEFIKKIQRKVDDKKLSVFRATQLMCDFLLKNKF